MRSNFWRTLHALRLITATISIVGTTLAFGYGADCFALLAKLEFGPALMACAAHFSISAAVVTLGILAMTAIFGRVYCSICCPLGILQDLLGFLFFWRKNRLQPRLFLLRKSLGVAIWSIALIGGWTLALRFLDPFTIYGSIAALSWVPLLVIALLTFWRRRVFCNTLCPVGALLACGSAMAPLGLRFTDRCIHCGKCVAACPAGCLDPSTATIDNGRCIRCLACTAVCPVGAITFGRNAGCHFPDRRTFLKAGAALTLGGALGVGAHHAKTLYTAYGARVDVAREGIYPPGAGSRQRFLTRCTDCRLCVTHCIGHVLQPAGRFGAVHLTFGEGMCEFNCTRCIDVCPTGALLPLNLTTKRRTRLGLAAVDYTLCIASVKRFECGACAEHCPTGALRMIEDAAGIRIPTLNSDLCIGCGSCEHPCPTRPIKAIRVWPIEVQVLAADPAEVFKSNEPTPSTSEDWLI
ncbi:MAG: 4Fe-4S binding protein [Kiritimatiellia bacterium]